MGINEIILKNARYAEKAKIAINPLKIDYMWQRGFKYDISLGFIEDGKEPIKCVGFKNPVRIFDNASIINNVENSGIMLEEIKTYILCEYDEELKYGQIFLYGDKKYMVLQPKERRKFGGVISKYAELKNETEGSFYG